MKELQKLLQHRIINDVFHTYLSYPTWKEAVEKEILVNKYYMGMDYYNQNDLLQPGRPKSRLLLKFAMVCKDWYNYIVSHLSTGFIYADFMFVAKQKIGKNLYTFLSKPKSLYRYNNIKTLYLDCYLGEVHPGAGRNLEIARIIQWVSKFTVLERVFVSTVSSRLVKQLLDRFPNIKVEVDISETESCDVNSMEEDLSKYDHSRLEFVYYKTLPMTNLQESLNDNINAIYNHIRKWRVDYIIFNYKNEQLEPRTLFRNRYKMLLLIKTIKNVKIVDDVVDTSELKWVVDNNSHLESFKAFVPLSLLDFKQQSKNYKVPHHEEGCRCQDWIDPDDPYTLRLNQINENELGHFQVFCEALATNKTLKSLTLKNQCRQIHEVATGHSLSQMALLSASGFLRKALAENNTLTFLSISSSILGDSFFKTMATDNRAITHLKLTEVQLTFTLDSLTEMLKQNHSITSLNIKYEEYDKKQTSRISPAWDSFCKVLTISTTLKKLSIVSMEARSNLRFGNEDIKYLVQENPLAAAQCKSFGKALASNQSIESLTLSCPLFSDCKVLYQSESRTNQTLKELRLKDCTLDHFLEMSRMLRINRSITRLSIYSFNDSQSYGYFSEASRNKSAMADKIIQSVDTFTKALKTHRLSKLTLENEDFLDLIDEQIIDMYGDLTGFDEMDYYTLDFDVVP
ncbi:hypothetical protein PPL_07965 [Heterostelium album PN500]|uniref:Uncharacterized protein n=1 Tax=Heterostelium pallidum (strain ATCC 26659 / Pp 5 / PN500) TaxID=670386 RepID=D3BHG3_HETP5|nr:hypothetical protein PPL_07965 [Heterostelium album PN500]EFA79140.1 hypothetical protein PPL_07965 [Heterostelium album PN500]|eukprot:XP_020431262.1 hypothetical protein PPL_07965 [Heterostelium album PN500]